MTPERWQQADRLLEEALALRGEERSAFLDDVCAGDDELRREIESLLSFHQQLGDYLETPPSELAAKVFVSGQAERAGQTIGHYRIVRSIGRGGMGDVYLAHDTRLGRKAALKMLPWRFTQDSDRLNRFRREARTASSLNHPNILTIYEIGEDNGAHFIASEFVEGFTLRTLVEEGQLNLGDVLDVAIQSAEALAAAHQAGIIHRDIKPENLMLRTDGYVKVLDFGLAKLSERAPTTSNHILDAQSYPTIETGAGIVMGTISYMSPEQARGFELDKRTDLFSLGIVIYEMIAGCQPFTGPSSSDVLVSLLNTEPPLLSKFVPQIPDQFQRIVSRVLAKDPDHRHQSAVELLDDLKSLKQELELKAKLRRIDSPAGNDAPTLEMLLGRAAENADNQIRDRQAREIAVGAAAIKSRPQFRIGGLFEWGRKPIWRIAGLSGVIILATLILAFTWRGATGYFNTSHSKEPINTLAVLPFTNVLADPQMDYLTDGITEGIIDNLSQVPPLSVLARSTVYSYRDRYKNRELDPREAGRVLNVRAVVLGRVQRQGEHLLIRVELVDTGDGRLLWSEPYLHPLADLNAVQQEITAEISEKLRLRLSGTQQQQLAKRQTANSEAYQLYLQGRHYLLLGTRGNWEKALTYYNQAIALDPNYALAHAGAADAYMSLTTQFMQPAEVIAKARQAALNAIRLDELLPEAHYALARAKLFCDWDWDWAEREYKRALELNPNFDLAHSRYSTLLSLQGRFAEALSEARRAQELNPLSPQAISSLGIIFYTARQYDEALVYYRKVLELTPYNGAYHIYPGRALLQQGKYQEALAELRQAVAADPLPSSRAWLAYGYARAGQHDEARKLLRELETQARHEHVPPVYLARIYLALGNHDQAFAWLRRGIGEHADQVLNIGQEEVYDPLRGDPRFTEMLKEIGLAK